MKKKLSFVNAMLLALLLALAACGGAAEDPAPSSTEDDTDSSSEVMDDDAMMEEGSVWVLLPDSASSARWETDDRRFLSEAFEAAGVDYNIVNAEGDAATQQTQAEQAITSGAKVIMMVNLDSGSGASIIDLAHEAGVMVIDYDRLTIEGSGADAYVSFDNVAVGRTMAEVLEPLINAQDGTPQVVQMNGGPTDNNATLFREGYNGIAQPYFDSGDWDLVADQAVPGWDNQEALVIFEQILTSANGEISAVFAANDGIGGAVIAALQNAGIDPSDAGIPISGQDATVGGIQHVLAGDQAMTVYKSIKAEAETAAAVAVAMLNGEDWADLTGGATIDNGTSQVPFIGLTPVGVTKDNVAETVIADGFRSWEEVCVGEFAQFCPEEHGGMAAMTDGDMMDGSIWVLLPDSASSARWETDDRRYLTEAFEAAGVDYNIVNAEGDAATQQTQAEQAITSGAKVIMMVNLDSGSGASIIDLAHEAGVKVVDYDRLTIEGSGADAYVSFDNVAVGRTMAEVLEPMINAQEGTPQVVQMNGGPTDNNATLFRDGYNGIAQPYFDSGDWDLVADQAVPGWDNQEALVIFEQILTSADGEVTAVFAANDGIGGAVIAALQNAGIDPGDAGIPISGQDATVGGIQHVLAGDQAMTVYKSIKAEAEAGAAVAIALLQGQDLASLTGGQTIDNGTSQVPFIGLTPVGVTKDNVADTVIADGFRTWEEVCVGDFAQFCPEAHGGMAAMADGEAMGDIEGSVWVLLPDSASSARWETDDRRFLSEAFEAAGVEYNIVNAEGDAATQQTQAEQAITSGAKVIMMVNLDSGSGASIIDLAHEAGVMVIDYDRLTIEGGGADAYVSFDNEAVGRTMAEIVEPMINAQDGTPQVVQMNGGPTDNNATLFRNGYFGIASSYYDSGAWNLVADQAVPGWDNQEALVIFEQILTSADGDVTAVFAANDGIGGAVIAALQNAGIDPGDAGIPITGQDATVGGIQHIIAGDQAMTVYKSIKAEAEAAAAVAIAMLQGKDLAGLTGGATIDNGTNMVPFIGLTPVGVTADNVAETVIADGFRTWEEVCVGDFAQYCP